MNRRRARARASSREPASPAHDPAPASNAGSRVELVDGARGVAVAMMIAYHFCFDLTFYRWADWPMLDDPRWIAARSAIVTCFLFLAGVSLALRDDRDRRRGVSTASGRAFVRRWLQVAGSAALVTAGSALLFPATFIYFGVLHFVAVGVCICRRAPRLGSGAIVAGIVVLAIGAAFSSPAFDSRTVNWIGFAAEKPLTEDYVPLFPWLGVLLIGCGAGALWGRHDFRTAPAVSAAWHRLPGGVRRLLVVGGRWSLTVYLLHQPLMLGTLGTLAIIRRIA